MAHQYPRIELNNRNFLLSIWPEYHTRLFPESKLNNESSNVVEDTVYANARSKIYLSAAYGADSLKKGDVILIYRTKDPNSSAPAHYTSVATSICVVESVRLINTFSDVSDFKNYIGKHSVFTDAELSKFWKDKNYPYIIKFDYYFSLQKRITLGELRNIFSLQNKNARLTFLRLSDRELRDILNGSGDSEFII